MDWFGNERREYGKGRIPDLEVASGYLERRPGYRTDSGTYFEALINQLKGEKPPASAEVDVISHITGASMEEVRKGGIPGREDIGRQELGDGIWIGVTDSEGGEARFVDRILSGNPGECKETKWVDYYVRGDQLMTATFEEVPDYPVFPMEVIDQEGGRGVLGRVREDGPGVLLPNWGVGLPDGGPVFDPEEDSRGNAGARNGQFPEEF